MSSEILLPASFAILPAGALLFTNAIEWFGLIPIVAPVDGGKGSEDVAVGAIIGAPLLLATIAMALVGLGAVRYAVFVVYVVSTA